MCLRRQILTFFFGAVSLLACAPAHAANSLPYAPESAPSELLVAKLAENSRDYVSLAVPAAGSEQKESQDAIAPVGKPAQEPAAAPAALSQGGPQAEAATPALDPKPAAAPGTDQPLSGDVITLQVPPPLGITFSTNATASRAVERNVSFFSERLKSRFAMWMERSGKYMDIMKDVMKERNMPEELVFLPFVESGFNVNAYSRARAVGPWQFIEGTAKRYGLTIDWWRDERKDPVKSTRAAASYLRDLYKMFGSWNLALAAYNAGEGRISKAMRRSDADDYWDLLHTKQIHPETKEYVPRYIAAAMIASEPEKYGFRDLAYHEPLDYDEVTLHGPVDIDVIAKCAETDVAAIRELNPELRRWSTPPNMSSYTIRIPAESKDIFVDNLERIPAKERFSYDTYKVKKKENLKGIAKKLNVPVGTLAALNGMGGIEAVSAGETIKIPPKDKFVTDLDDRMSAKKGNKSKKVLAKKKGKSKGKAEPKTKQVDKKSKAKGKKVKTKKA